MANASWIEAFPKALVRHLHVEELDHCSILLQTENVENKANLPFRFFQAEPQTPHASKL